MHTINKSCQSRFRKINVIQCQQAKEMRMMCEMCKDTSLTVIKLNMMIMCFLRKVLQLHLNIELCIKS